MLKVAFVALVHAVVFVALKVIITGGGLSCGRSGCLRRRGSAFGIASIFRAAAMLLSSAFHCSHMALVFSLGASISAKIINNTSYILVCEARLESARRIGRAQARLAPRNVGFVNVDQLHA